MYINVGIIGAYVFFMCEMAFSGSPWVAVDHR